MNKIVTLLAALSVFAVAAIADTVTNRGEVIEVNTLTNNPEGDQTVVKDISKPATQADRSGLLVVEFDFSVDGTDTPNGDQFAYPLNGYGTLPKGAILQDAYLELTTDINDSYSTNNVLGIGVAGETAILVSGDTYMAATFDADGGVGLYRLAPQESLGAAITTASRVRFDSITSTNALSSGKAVLYVSYILGHDQ